MADEFQILCSETKNCIEVLKSISGNSNQNLNPLEIVKALGPTLAILTGVVGIWLNHWLAQRARNKQSLKNQKRLASAILGEVKATRQHIIDNRYIPFYKILQQNFEKGINTKIPERNSSGIFFITYSNNSTEIGSLPEPLPQMISAIYTKYVGLQEDLRTAIMPEWNNCDIPQKLPTVKSMVRRFKNAQRESDNLINELNNFINKK